MANSAGAAQQVIVSPKGGDAQQGLGEKFAPDLQTGTGNFALPIAVPPGRNRFQWQLSLTCSTGNGLFGLALAISLSKIARRIATSIPRYRHHDPDLRKRDVLPLFGAEDLNSRQSRHRRV